MHELLVWTDESWGRDAARGRRSVVDLLAIARVLPAMDPHAWPPAVAATVNQRAGAV